MTTSTAPRQARPVRQEWDRLAAAGPTPETFDAEMLLGLPEPARRWLTHAIAPGTPLWRSVELSMHGHLRLGTWRRFTASQVATPPDGYIWRQEPRSSVCRLSATTA